MNDCMALTASGEIPTLLAMAHQKDNAKSVKSLVLLNFAALDEYLHLNNRMSEEELVTLAEDVVEEYGGMLSFADLNLIINNIKRGVYGKLYERLSSVEIMMWISEYCDKRLEEAGSISFGEHERSPLRERVEGIEKNNDPKAIRFYLEKKQEILEIQKGDARIYAQRTHEKGFGI